MQVSDWAGSSLGWQTPWDPQVQLTSHIKLPASKTLTSIQLASLLLTPVRSGHRLWNNCPCSVFLCSPPQSSPSSQGICEVTQAFIFNLYSMRHSNQLLLMCKDRGERLERRNNILAFLPSLPPLLPVWTPSLSLFWRCLWHQPAHRPGWVLWHYWYWNCGTALKECWGFFMLSKHEELFQSARVSSSCWTGASS